MESMDLRAEIRQYLSSRRARLTPEQAGAAGLRRPSPTPCSSTRPNATTSTPSPASPARPGPLLPRARVPALTDPRRPANTTRFVYLDPEAARTFFVDYEQVTRDAAAMLHLEAGRNPHDKALTAQIREGQGKIFAEDLEMLERQQQNISAFPERALLKLNIDTGGVQSRRVIDRVIAAEQAGAAAVAA
jgi:hypothetical protein